MPAILPAFLRSYLTLGRGVGGRAIGPIRRASKCARATAAQPNFELRAPEPAFGAAER